MQPPSPPSSRAVPVEKKVFVNVPYDREYAPLFTALIACLVGMGLVPHCGLESQSSGTDRLRGILQLLSSCGASIHDLSRMSLSGPLRVPRFNMPFELGIAYALQSTRERDQGLPHRIFVVDEKRRRLDSALSDMGGFDPLIHRGTREGILEVVLDCFDRPEGVPDEDKLRRLIAGLSEDTLALQRKRNAKDPFRLSIFRQMVLSAGRRAKDEGLLVT